MFKKLIPLIVLFVLALGGYILYTNRKPPSPYLAAIESPSDLGRNHVSEDTQVDYNSNPPTSGNHFEKWTEAGIYTEPDTDGHLVHSLEHGYVIISYNCDSEDPDCQKLISDLSAIYEEMARNKLIVIPRPSLDTKIALTAWGKLDKFNDFDHDRIAFFIDKFRDQGPEKTLEVAH